MKLDGRWFESSGSRLVLAVPRGELVKQALLQLIVLPALAAVVVLYGTAIDDPALSLFVGGAIGLVAAPVAAIGAVGLVRAGAIAERSRVVVDQGRVVHADGSLPAGSVTGLVVRQQSPWLKFLALDAEVRTPPDDAPDPWLAPADGRLRLLHRVPPAAGDELAEIGRHVAKALGVELRIEGGVDKKSALGMSPATVSMLCYLPVQGIFLLASVAVLVVRPDDPQVRFHARQSLVLFAVELAAFAVAIGLLLLSMAVAGEEAGLVVGMVALVGVALGRLAVRLFACFKAARYEAWVVPGLGGIVGRWKP